MNFIALTYQEEKLFQEAMSCMRTKQTITAPIHEIYTANVNKVRSVPNIDCHI